MLKLRRKERGHLVALIEIRLHLNSCINWACLKKKIRQFFQSSNPFPSIIFIRSDTKRKML